MSGTYRWSQAATHYFNPATGVAVATTPGGECEYISAWTLGADQMAHFLKSGDLF